MSQFEEIITGESTEMPSRLTVYGCSKIGKSRFAAEFPDVFFINIENGLQFLPKKVRATPHLRDYQSVIDWLKHIYDNDAFTAKWICVDSIDWLEEYAEARLIKLHNAKSITDPQVKEFAYFKGKLQAANDAMVLLKWLDAIYLKKGIKSILIGHSVVKDIELPNREPFARHQLKLSKQFAAKVMEWSDAILFAERDFEVSSEGKTSIPKPCLFTGGDMSYEGGGRFKLPRAIPINYKLFEDAVLGKKDLQK